MVPREALAGVEHWTMVEVTKGVLVLECSSSEKGCPWFWSLDILFLLGASLSHKRSLKSPAIN